MTEDNYVETRAAVERDCSEMGKNFVTSLRERTGKQLDVVGIPIALASVFDELIQGDVDLKSFYLESTISTLVGMRLERYAPGIVSLDTRLKEIGATSQKNKVNNGGDNYIYSISSKYWRHALICETQNRYFIVLMRFGYDGSTDSSKLKTELAPYYRPQIYIGQEPWSKTGASIKKYVDMPDRELPEWIDDSNLHGYVAFLRYGEVKGAIHHYGKICYCLGNLASFIEFKDELEL